MRDPRTPKHIKLLGQPDVAGAHLPLGVSKLEDEYRESPPYEVPHLTRYQVGPDYTTESRIHGDQHYVTVLGGAECRDKQGFLLAKMGSNYDAHYNDGLVERINPIDGQPRPEPDPADRTKGYKVPLELRVAASTRPTASRFTGLMRLAVGCYHAAGKDAPFSFTFAKTHGILKFDVPVGNPSVPTPRYWVIEISASGVFAAPVENTGKCCDSWSVTRYVPTAEEIAEQPSLEGFKTTLSLNWAFSVARPRVLQLATASEMTGFYTSGAPWYPECGWAFSASGVSAQNVVVSESGVPAPVHYLCSRFKLAFSLNPSTNDPEVALTTVELQRVAAFPDFSGVWFPTGANSWRNTDGATAAQQATMPFSSQNAPVHVYYKGEDEIVTRWMLTRQSVAGGSFGPCSGGNLKVFGGAEVFCRDLIAAHDEPVCQGANSSPHDDATADFFLQWETGFLVHQGEFVYGGTTVRPTAHTKITAGFSSPNYSDLLERSSKFATTNETIQEAKQEFSNVVASTLYDLAETCWHDEVRSTPPFDTVTVKHAPVSQVTIETKATVYVRQRNSTDTLTARTNFVMFLGEREAVLHVTKSSEQNVGTVQNSPIPGGANFGAHISQTKTKLNPVTSGIYPGFTAAQLDSPFTNWTAGLLPSIGTLAGFTTDTSIQPVNTFAPSATGTLFVGPVTAAVSLPTETVAGGAMPTSALSPFAYGAFPSPPIGVIDISSPAFAQHGNLYYDDPALEPPGQSGNAVYLLEFGTTVTAGGFDPNIEEVVGFVGKA